MFISRKVACLLSVALVAPTAVMGGFWSKAENEEEAKKPRDEPVHYGVDVSFPIHYATVSDNYAWLEHNINPDIPTPDKYKDKVVQPLGNRQEFYKEFINGCVDKFAPRGSRCISTEADRVAMSLRQPQSMQNYTKIGFKKIRAPENVFRMVKDFWDKNKNKGKPENWGVGNTYTNNWAVPTTMVSVEDGTLRGGGRLLKQQLWDAARDTIQEWTGEELTECSLYGIRIYHEGAVLATHVDRLPLVSSAIINVDSDVDEPWPLEVYDHQGNAVNVTMEPGDMVLYESHSVLHGRPFPLKGRYVANLFIHFEPTGHSLRHNARMEQEQKDKDAQYRDALQRGVGGHESDHSGLPSYIVEGTPEEERWRKTHPGGYKSKRRSSVTGSTVAHLAAQGGDLDALKREVENKEGAINQKDANGWTPLHEGARGGHIEVVKYLAEHGADLDSVTGGGTSGSALWWARKTHGDDHPIIELLEQLGAAEIGPDL